MYIIFTTGIIDSYIAIHINAILGIIVISMMMANGYHA